MKHVWIIETRDNFMSVIIIKIIFILQSPENISPFYDFTNRKFTWESLDTDILKHITDRHYFEMVVHKNISQKCQYKIELT